MSEKKNNEWDEFIKSVKPIQKNKIKPAQHKRNQENFELSYQKTLEKVNLENIEILDNTFELQNNTDKDLVKKVKRRKKRIDAALDLHGLKVYEAKNKVFQFISSNFENRNRLVLIITGKGKRSGVEYGWQGSGILKELVPQWLGSILISKFVLWYTQAPNNLGGNGAYIVRLKKFKE